MTQYVDLLTEVVFTAIKNGNPTQFEADFRDAFLKAAYKEHLSGGQRQSFYNTVRTRVKRRVSRYQTRHPQLPLQMMSLTKPPETAPVPMPEHFRAWYQDFKSKRLS